MKRYYRVGELAKLYGASPDLLRYYEEKGLLCPQRQENGYRAYRVQDVWRLNVIRDLRVLVPTSKSSSIGRPPPCGNSMTA